MEIRLGGSFHVISRLCYVNTERPRADLQNMAVCTKRQDVFKLFTDSSLEESVHLDSMLAVEVEVT